MSRIIQKIGVKWLMDGWMDWWMYNGKNILFCFIFDSTATQPFMTYKYLFRVEFLSGNGNGIPKIVCLNFSSSFFSVEKNQCFWTNCRMSKKKNSISKFFFLAKIFIWNWVKNVVKLTGIIGFGDEKIN